MTERNIGKRSNKVRCTRCRGYFDRVEAFAATNVNRFCSEQCLDEHRDALNEKRRARERAKAPAKQARIRKKAFADPQYAVIREAVRARDGHRCRWCGGTDGIEVHHVRYRSQGGPDHHSNLLTLCAEHHRKAHGNKRYWQPILLALLWVGYVERRHMTVPEVETLCARRGLLADEVAA